MVEKVIINNLIALVIHAAISIVLWLPTAFIWQWGVWNHRIKSYSLIENWVLIGIFTMITFSIYFWLGRKYLSNTNRTLTNVFSVAVVPVVISLVAFIGWLSPYNPSFGMFMLGILISPIHPISETISFYFGMERIGGHMIMSFLPSIAMLRGMTTKR